MTPAPRPRWPPLGSSADVGHFAVLGRHGRRIRESSAPLSRAAATSHRRGEPLSSRAHTTTRRWPRLLADHDAPFGDMSSSSTVRR